MHIVVFVTAARKQEARVISKALLDKKLAACVNIVDSVDSWFWWKGRCEHSAEVLMVIKTRRALLSKLIAAVKSLHSYTVPEIIALPVVGGSKEYLGWIDESTG